MAEVEYINQWDVEEEEEVQDTSALKARQYQLQYSKEDIILNGVAPATQQYSLTINGGGPHSEVVFSASVNGEQALIQKVEETATNGEAICSIVTTISVGESQNNDNFYFDKQQVAGNELNGLTGVQTCDGSKPVVLESHGVGEIDIQEENPDMQYNISEFNKNLRMERIDDKVLSSSELSSLENSSEVVQPDESRAKAADTQLIKEIDQKLEEFHEMFANQVENGNYFKGAASGVEARNGDVIHRVTMSLAGSQNKNNVYFDEQRGMWKCYHCSWTKRFENLKEYSSSDLLMNAKFKTMIQHGPCFDCETKGHDSGGLTQIQNGYDSMPVLPVSRGVGGIDIEVDNSDIQNGLLNGINNTCMQAIAEKVLSSELQPDESSVKAGPNFTKEIEQKLEEFDVEEVLEKQETHDLFCPNCNSCITKRVILKKRKRKLSKNNLESKEKREKLGAKVVKSSAAGDDDAIPASDAGTVEQPVNNDEPERDTEVFRCLSCFSFFIPLKNGFKLFPKFGRSREPGSSQTPLVQPASTLGNPLNAGDSNKNWFFRFALNGRKKEHGEDDQLADTSISNNTQPTKDFIESSTERVDSPLPAVTSAESEPQKTSIVNSSDLMTGNVSANVGEGENDSVDMTKTDTVVADKPLMSFPTAAAATAITEINFNNGKNVKDADSDIVGSGVVDAAISSGLDFMKGQNDIKEEIKLLVRDEKDNQDALESQTSRTEDNNVPDEGAIATQEHTQIDIGEEPRARTSEPQEWEIVKSIVYGGLMESITSLGIVSSAISSGAAPLNIIALGLANLIGGLFILGHDLIELKNDHSEGDPQQSNMRQDRYKEQLGRRENFLLHVFAAVLSFLIFGSVPMIVYGLLVNKDYYDEVKVGIVAATSVVCIFVLAIGKAYTGRPPRSYTKTVLQYVTMAVATSGVTYLAGDLLKNVLEKFNPPESGAVVLGMPFSGTARMEPNWMSY